MKDGDFHRFFVKVSQWVDILNYHDIGNFWMILPDLQIRICDLLEEADPLKDSTLNQNLSTCDSATLIQSFV